MGEIAIKKHKPVEKTGRYPTDQVHQKQAMVCIQVERGTLFFRVRRTKCITRTALHNISATKCTHIANRSEVFSSADQTHMRPDVKLVDNLNEVKNKTRPRHDTIGLEFWVV